MLLEAQDILEAHSVRVLFSQTSISLFGLSACWYYFSINLVCILKQDHSLMCLPLFPPRHSTCLHQRSLFCLLILSSGIWRLVNY